MNFLAGAGCLVMGAYGLAQLVAGFQGVDYHFGMVWAVIATIAALLFRFPLLITIAAFFGAKDVWDWHWAFAALFAAPGLLLVVPAFLSVVIASISKVFTRDA